MNPLITIEERRAILDRITETVIGCAHQVSNILGVGFLEKVYENALVIELHHAGLDVTQQRRIEVRYREIPVGDFVADIVVQDRVIIEVKAIKTLEEIHYAQCLNYLRGTNLHECLLVNFGTPRAVIKRVVHNF